MIAIDKTFGLLRLGLIGVLIVSFFTSCRGVVPNTNNPSPTLSPLSSPSSSPTPVKETIATIAEIAKQPVWVRPLDSTQEIAATEGMPLHVGEMIRTDNEGMAQIELKNGLAFRIGGNATVTLQANNQLKVDAGEIVTWIQPGKKVQAEIVTPAGVAGIRGTTVYIQIPQDANQKTLFFAWEGRVTVRLPGQTEEVVLRTGEEVTVKPGEKDFQKLRSSLRRLQRAEWSQLRRCTREQGCPQCSKLKRLRLFRGFKKPLPTQSLIDRAVLGQESKE